MFYPKAKFIKKLGITRRFYESIAGKAFPYPVKVIGKAHPQHTDAHVSAYYEWERRVDAPKRSRRGWDAEALQRSEQLKERFKAQKRGEAAAR